MFWTSGFSFSVSVDWNNMGKHGPKKSSLWHHFDLELYSFFLHDLFHSQILVLTLCFNSQHLLLIISGDCDRL